MLLFPRWTIRGYLYALIVALGLPLLVLLAMSTYGDVQDDERYAAMSALNPASSTASTTTQVIEDHRRILERLAERPLVRALDASRCDPLLRELVDLSRTMSNVWINDRQSRTLCSARPLPKSTTLDAANARWFPHALLENRFVISRPFTGPISGKLVMVLSSPIRDRHGAVLGVVSIALELSKLLSPAVLGDSPAGTRLAIIDREGNVLAQLPEDDQWLGKSIRHLPAADRALRNSRGVFDGHDLTGEPTVFGFDSVDGVDWRVIVGVPAVVAYGELRESVTRQAVAIPLVLLGIALFAGLFSRRITRSVQGIAATASAVAGGNLDARAPASHTADLAEVATQFNHMLEVRMRGEKELRESRRQLATLISNIPGAAYRCHHDRTWKVEYVSDGMKALLGHDAARFSGMRVRAYGAMIHAEDREPLWERVNAALAAREPFELEYRIRAADGTQKWLWDRGCGVYDDAGKVVAIEGFLTDITERKEHGERLTYLAQYDTLTGLPNRSLFRDRLEGAIARTRRSGGSVALFYFDLDRFKEVNDGLGHPAGDEILKQVAARVTGILRETDTVARLGGDEFTVILEDADPHEEIDAVAAKILDALSAPMHVRGNEIFVSASIGIAVFPSDAADAESLVRDADIAMYQAKHAGRNTYARFSGTPSGAGQITLETKLRRALEREEFLLSYQPQVSVHSGRIVGAEALIRWDNPDLGRVSPNRFIPLAEETGLIVPIGEWVMRTAAAQNKAWQDAGLEPIVMAVNLSVRQFRQRKLAESIAALLHAAKLEPRYFELEITESAVMQNSREAAAMLDELDHMGVRLSVDDFGTGYSSLAYLKRFPVHKLKIDQSFIRDSVANADSAAIVGAVVAMARGLRLASIAEGVETVEQIALLRALGCDEYQGFFFSAPVGADTFAEMLRQQSRAAVPLRRSHG